MNVIMKVRDSKWATTEVWGDICCVSPTLIV